jgi:hypothetical protein
MKISEMEEQIRIIDARTLRIEQILPTLVTKDDLKAELQLVIAALQHEMAGLAARSDRIEVRTATLATKQQLDEAVSKLATKDEIATLVTRDEFAKAATKEDVLALSKQIASLGLRRARRRG